MMSLLARYKCISTDLSKPHFTTHTSSLLYKLLSILFLFGANFSESNHLNVQVSSHGWMGSRNPDMPWNRSAKHYVAPKPLLSHSWAAVGETHPSGGFPKEGPSKPHRSCVVQNGNHHTKTVRAATASRIPPDKGDLQF